MHYVLWDWTLATAWRAMAGYGRAGQAGAMAGRAVRAYQPGRAEGPGREGRPVREGHSWAGHSWARLWTDGLLHLVPPPIGCHFAVLQIGQNRAKIAVCSRWSLKSWSANRCKQSANKSCWCTMCVMELTAQ